jgi:hypothetical protein
MHYKPIQIINISEWNIKEWLGTKGTREKFICESPLDETVYYFKQSLFKENKDYKYEFWSEIIASKLGQVLGLNLLDYNVGIYQDIIGCLCQSMLNDNAQNQYYEELREGVNYLAAIYPEFLSEDKEVIKLYSFQLIEKALKDNNLEKFIPHILDIIIFDSIIGNQDRHQENWGTITSWEFKTYLDGETVAETALSKGFWTSFGTRILNTFANKTKSEEVIRTEKDLPNIKVAFAPIYDSGSSLGREVAEDKLTDMLRDDVRLNAYINRGKSEIRWKGDKVSHFILIKNLIDHFPELKQRILNIFSKIDDKKIIGIINEIDKDVPAQFSSYKLTIVRKQFIVKLIIERIKKLKEIINLCL